MSHKASLSLQGSKELGPPSLSHGLLQGVMVMDPDETVVEVPVELEKPSSYLLWDRRHVSSPEAEGNHERFAILMEVERDQVLGNGSAFKAIPPHTWDAQIIKDYLQEIVKPISHIAVLNQTDCVIFSGNRARKEGMTFDAARHAARKLSKIDNWVGKKVVVRAVPLMVVDARRTVADADIFIRAQTVKRLAAEKAKAEKAKAEKMRPLDKQLALRGRGFTHRADLYYAQKSQKPGKTKPSQDADALSRGAEQVRLLETSRPNTPSEYGSAHEEVSDTESGETTETEEEDASESTMSYDTEHSRFSTIADLNRRRNRARRCEQCRARQRGNWRGGIGGRPVNLKIFRASKKEGSLSYEDWRIEVSAMVSSGMDLIRIRDAIMQSLEGPPAQTSKIALSG